MTVKRLNFLRPLTLAAMVQRIIGAAVMVALLAPAAHAEGENSGIYDVQRGRSMAPSYQMAPRYVVPRAAYGAVPHRAAPRAMAYAPQAPRVMQRPVSGFAALFAPAAPVAYYPQTTSNSVGREVPLLSIHPPQRRMGAPVRSRAAEPDEEDAQAENPAVTGPQAYCVRTCDGFFFPAGPVMSGQNGREAQQFICNRMCPGAEVALYTVPTGDTIENATGPKGQVYSRLKTAFQFREQLSPACTCSGPGKALASFPISHDFTLRRGDMVVNDNGITLFKGASRFPYKNSDFMLARNNYSRLPADVRRAVSAIETGRAYGEQGRLGSLRSGRLPPMYAAASAPVTTGAVDDNGVRVLDMSLRQEPAPIELPTLAKGRKR